MKSLFRKNIFNSLTQPFLRDASKMEAFTEFPLKRETEEQGKKVATGRSWDADELRLKSEEDLHKLWYVLLREKNMIKSDNVLKRKLFGGIGQQGRMGKVRVSMARLLTVVNERKKVREDYRRHLEEEYIKSQRQAYDKQYAEQEAEELKEPYTPKITFNLLRAKYNDLKRGVDNVDYIKKAVQLEQNKEQLKAYLDEKYDYKTKKIAKPGNALDSTASNEIIQGFQSGILEQLNSGNYKLSQEEVLRSHIKNWKMLDFKQRRIILAQLNARRARDAKGEFLKELNILGQKIAYDNLQSNSTKTNTTA